MVFMWVLNERCNACVVCEKLVLYVSGDLIKCCWNGRFGDETDHLMMNELGGELALEAVYEAQAKLNLLDETIFPLLPLQRQHSSSNVSIRQYVNTKLNWSGYITATSLTQHYSPLAS